MKTLISTNKIKLRYSDDSDYGYYKNGSVWVICLWLFYLTYYKNGTPKGI